MRRIISTPNEAHLAADEPDVISFERHTHTTTKGIVYACFNPECKKKEKQVTAVRWLTTAVMMAATITGVWSFVTGDYTLTILSLLSGNVSHAIDTWVLDAVKDAYHNARDIIGGRSHV